jgi:hypothetical protein
MSGSGTTTWRSKRPGRSSAGSSTSGRLVAAMTMTPSLAFEAVHLDQHLVQRLLALVVAAAQAGATLAADGVDFVDEDDAGRVLLGLLEHVAHAAAPTPTNISTKSEPEIEKNGTLASPAMALASSVLPVPGGPTSSTPRGMRPPSFWNLDGIAQEVDQFLHFLLGLVATGDVGEGVVLLVLVSMRALLLPKRERAALAAALHLAHEEDPHADQQQHRAGCRNCSCNALRNSMKPSP